MRGCLLIISIILLLTTVSLADDPVTVFSSPVTAANRKAFSAQIKKLQFEGVHTKNFEQHKQVAALKRPLISKGIILLSPMGICLATQSPFSASVKITTDGIWQQSGDRKATVKSADKNFEIRHTANILIALFTANTSVLEKQFNLFYIKRAGHFQIGLRPKDRILAKIISDIVIEGTDEIHKIAIREANGDTTVILISEETPSKKITLETCIK